MTSYADLGMRAFGIWGYRAATFTQYLTLCGITIVFMILFGILPSRSLYVHLVGQLMTLVQVIGCFPAPIYTLAAGLLLMALNVFIPKLKEAKWMTYQFSRSSITN